MPYSFESGVVVFGIGMAGAATFLFLYLLIQRNFDNLDNKVVSSKKWMTFFYVLAGGFTTLMWTLSSFDELTTQKVFQIYTIGLGWQGMITGLITANDVSDGKKLEKANQRIEMLELDLEKADKKIKELLLSK